MEIVQPFPRVCGVKIYDKRDKMPTLASYRRFPHIETTISKIKSYKYAVFHSQLICRSHIVAHREFFIEAASRLIRDNIYVYTRV